MMWRHLRFLPIYVMVVALLCVYLFYPEPVKVGKHQIATPAPELKHADTEPVIIDFVQVYKPAVKKKLRLPQAVQQADNQSVVAAVTTRGDNHPHTVTTLLDLNTGAFSTYDRRDPLPWITVANTTHISAYYGFKDSGPIVRIQAQRELLSVKALNIEVVANMDIGDGKPDTFVGIGGRISF